MVTNLQKKNKHRYEQIETGHSTKDLCIKKNYDKIMLVNFAFSYIFILNHKTNSIHNEKKVEMSQCNSYFFK